jgi:soluble lytic murein transglycosylase
MKSFLATLILASASFAYAEATKISIPKDLSEKTVVDLYSIHSSKKAGLSSLSQLKDYEIHLKWSDCSKLAPKVFASNKDLQGWVALSWLHCAEQEVKKGAAVATLHTVLNTLEPQEKLFVEGPWANELTQTWVALRLKYLDAQVAKKDTKVMASLEKLLAERYQLSKEQKAQVFQLLGDVALLKVNYPEAQFLYEQAQDIKDSTYLQEKIDFLLKTKGVVATPKMVSEAIPEVGEEIRIEERIRQSLKQNELTSAAQDSVLVLNQFPGSRAARRLKDKPLEIYLQLPEGSAKNKTLGLMQDVDTTRMIEWAQNLHRRADYVGALELAQTVAEKSSGSAQATSAWWIAGRSAHFLGKYERALEYFGKLIVAHAGSEEAAEALFRSSLIYYRKKDFSSATALLERLLLQNRDKYDLNGRYWLVRCLQETNPDRAKIEATDLMTRYPFSYYGLRLRAESQAQKLSWPEVKEKVTLQTDLYLVGDQKKSWSRFKTLSASGWLSEAQRELSGLPSLKDPTLKISFAEKLAERGQYMPAIRMINDAMEADPRLRQEQFLKIGYPTAFKDLYNAEAERYGVNIAVLRSLTRQESGFNLRAVSTSNALGLMQMIPPTAAEVSKKLGLKIEIPDDMFRPEVNIPMGSFYISQMLDQFQGNVPVALAAYNAGPTKVKIWIELRPEVSTLVATQSSLPLDELWFDELPWTETSFYVKAILRNILLYRLVDEGSFTLKPVLWQDLRNKKAK